jgi:hypothetical protein
VHDVRPDAGVEPTNSATESVLPGSEISGRADRQEPTTQAIITHHHDRTRIKARRQVAEMVEDGRQLIFG